MTMKYKIKLFNDWISATKTPLVIVSALGFEARDIGVYKKIVKRDYVKFIEVAYLIDYNNYDHNEPNRSQIITFLSEHNVTYQIKKEHQIGSIVSDIVNRYGKGFKVLVDITGMSRLMMFYVIHEMIYAGLLFDIGYTEAKEYKPSYDFYLKLRDSLNSSKVIFDTYEQLEKAEIIYSSQCNVHMPKLFQGDTDPSMPASLIGFLTFKRSRIQALLQAFEFNERFLVISKPVRPDLVWRADLLKLVNHDILNSRPTKTLEIETLDPFGVYEKLEQLIYEEPALRKSSIFLAPLGSKMQNVGCYLLWKNNPHISLVFSEPEYFFKDAYSSGYYSTFIIESSRLQSYINRR